MAFASCRGNATGKQNESIGEVESKQTTDTTPAQRPHHGRLTHQSKGSLSFKLNGELYEADAAHVKSFSNTQIPLAMIMARNEKGLTVSMQINGGNKEGEYKIDRDGKGTVGFNINNKMYWVRMPSKGDYLTVTITATKPIATVILLTGTFEGQLEDKDGNRITITDGNFTTESL